VLMDVPWPSGLARRQDIRMTWERQTLNCRCQDLDLM
jgi:hypothetical protein